MTGCEWCHQTACTDLQCMPPEAIRVNGALCCNQIGCDDCDCPLPALADSLDVALDVQPAAVTA